jgi:hypothetical protein
MSGEKRRASTTRAATAHEVGSAAERAASPLDDMVVSRALHRGDLNLVVRYLREVIIPLVQRRVPGRFCSTATIGLLADVLEGRESTPWHLKRVWARRGKPTDIVGTARKNIAIGSCIAARLQSGEILKVAVAETCEEKGITPAHAYKCLELFKKYAFHNERGEPMPLPDRPRRRRVKTTT